MATVYKAVVRGAAGFQRTVAIKHIRPEFRALKNYIDMFIEEARVGSELAHPNIVQVHDFLIENNSYYLVMEWVEGIDLGGFIRVYRDFGLGPGNDRHVPWPVAVSVGIHTLRGLGAAHERVAPDGTPAPVIHRDVSPHNVLLGHNGVAKLSDFGLARARDRAASLTAPGTVKGKLSYLAPEVTFGKPNTVQSDLFGVGSVLWETLSGERLFDGKTDIEIFKKIRACQIPPIRQRRPDVPQELAGVLEKSLAADPSKRYATADEFAQELGHVIKQVVGPDGASRLRTAVGEACARLGIGHPSGKHAAVVPAMDNQPTMSREIEFSEVDVVPSGAVTEPRIKKP
jgi:serine/threonine-protein kinase